MTTTNIPEGARVQIYWNLHKKCFSVVALDGPDKGRVIAHAPSVNLVNATFVVQPAGRERVLREERKNVHAFIRGLWTSRISHERGGWHRVAYNPYNNTTFVDMAEQSPVTDAPHAMGITLGGGRPAILAASN